MLRLTAAALLCCILTSGAHAALFFVDLQGIAGSGHTLQVTGTIDVNLTTDVVLGSQLTFFHGSDPGLPLPSMPSGSGVDFGLNMGMLSIEPGATDFSDLIWTGTSSSGFYDLYFYEGGGVSSPGISLIYAPFDSFHFDDVTLTAGGGSVKVGTAVPEPSAFIFLSLVGFVGVGARWWRNRRTRI